MHITCCNQYVSFLISDIIYCCDPQHSYTYQIYFFCLLTSSISTQCTYTSYDLYTADHFNAKHIYFLWPRWVEHLYTKHIYLVWPCWVWAFQHKAHTLLMTSMSPSISTQWTCISYDLYAYQYFCTKNI